MHESIPASLRAGPFTCGQAVAAGLSLAQLRHPRFRRIFRTVYVLDTLPDTRQQRLAAARLILPDRGVLTGPTAAWVLGADVRRQADLDVQVGFPKGGRIRPQSGLVICQETLDPLDVCRIDGVPVTTPVRTAFDCLRWLRGAEGIVVADALTHTGLTTVTELREYFAGKKRLRNLRIGARLVDDIDPKAESPMESRMRIALVRGGAGCPTTQIHVFDQFGNYLGRLDMGYEQLLLGAEYDGALHWQQRREDDRRRDRMRAAGWEILVFSADDVYGDPAAVAGAVIAAQYRRLRDLRRLSAS